MPSDWMDGPLNLFPEVNRQTYLSFQSGIFLLVSQSGMAEAMVLKYH